jgi:hypothetical protein
VQRDRRGAVRSAAIGRMRAVCLTQYGKAYLSANARAPVTRRLYPSPNLAAGWHASAAHHARPAFPGVRVFLSRSPNDCRERAFLRRSAND